MESVIFPFNMVCHLTLVALSSPHFTGSPSSRKRCLAFKDLTCVRSPGTVSWENKGAVGRALFEPQVFINEIIFTETGSLARGRNGWESLRAGLQTSH